MSVASAADGQRALSGGLDKKVRLWDVDSGHELYCYDRHTDVVTSVAFSPDGSQALTGSADRRYGSAPAGSFGLNVRQTGMSGPTGLSTWQSPRCQPAPSLRRISSGPVEHHRQLAADGDELPAFLDAVREPPRR